MKTEIYLLRHGETGLNINKVYFGHLDASMTEKGRESICSLAKTFNENIDVIVSSDLNRCYESSRFFKKNKSIDLFSDKRLRELDFGIFEGRIYEDLCKQFPEESKLFFSSEYNYVIPNGESIKMLFNRCVEIFDEIIEQYKGQRILFCTHGGPIRALLSHYLTGGDNAYWQFSIPHASMTKLVYEDGFTYMEYMGVSCKKKVKQQQKGKL